MSIDKPWLRCQVSGVRVEKLEELKPEH